MTKITPGIHNNVELFHYSEDQERVIRRFATEWFITHSGKSISLANSNYHYSLMKPTENYQELFNLEREIIIGFSDYPLFQPRVLDLFDYVANKFSDLRIEKVCAVLISKDKEISTKIRDLLKNDAEYQVVVPFHYEELIENNDPYFIRNRFREFFYSRDLFAFQAALKKELYFFGRSDLIHQIVNRHRSGENSGLFGLRKTGKTSVIYGIRRAIESTNGYSIFVDCQSPAFHQKPWNKALKYVIDQAEVDDAVKRVFQPIESYSPEQATETFEKDLLELYEKCGRKRILLVFDEIEQITPSISPSAHWREGSDFVFFWQSLRSLFQKHDNLFTYLLVGTNPKCVEVPLINGVDNPIFNQIPHEYIPPFDVPQTREMVRKLGKFMGLKFDEVVYGRLNDDFGGHPFLIRNVCSAINKIVGRERPVRIDKAVYEKGKELFLREYQSYIEMILSVLQEYYQDEYEMLRMLALDDHETFESFAELSREYTNHLSGYNIIDENKGRYSFKIEAVKQYLQTEHKYTSLVGSNLDNLTEISQRRNELEPKLRNIIRQVMVAKYGEGEAKTRITKVLGKTEPRYAAVSLKDLFDPNKSNIFFEDLRKIIAKDWDAFKHIFGSDLDAFNVNMKTVNKYRVDAHAKAISQDELAHFRVCIKQLENRVTEYL